MTTTTATTGARPLVPGTNLLFARTTKHNRDVLTTIGGKALVIRDDEATVWLAANSHNELPEKIHDAFASSFNCRIRH